MQQAETADTYTTRDVFMDNLKGLLIVSVVFVHMYDMTCAKNSWTHLMRLAILTVQMPLFMFISGYFGKNTKKRQKEAVESYLIPFFVFNISLSGTGRERISPTASSVRSICTGICSHSFCTAC